MKELIIKKISDLKRRKDELENLLVQPEAVEFSSRLVDLGKEYREITDILEIADKYLLTSSRLDEAKDLFQSEDIEYRELAREEVRLQEEELELFLRELIKAFIPRDPLDDRSVFIEIRAAAGGEESALFAADLLRMYSRYAEKKGYKYKLVDYNSTDIGGFKEAVLEIKGNGAYSQFKHEIGVHRVQRVPETESSGRVHTSTITVAVMPEVEDVEVEINEDDIRVDTFGAAGAGGQHVQMTDSAVRITHIPTGIVVSCQDERSQIKNREKALKVLRSRLYTFFKMKQDKEIASKRKSQVGKGERSEKIRTYNFPQNRITDHRIDLSVYNLNYVLEGNMELIIEPLQLSLQEEFIKELN